MDFGLLDDCLSNTIGPELENAQKSFVRHRDIISLQCLFVVLVVSRTKRVIQESLMQERTKEMSRESYFIKSKHLNREVMIKIGIIGCGSVGKSVLEALLFYKDTPFKPNNIVICTRRPTTTLGATLCNFGPSTLDKKDPPRIASLKLDKVVDDNKQVINSRCDVIILCIQPSQLPNVQQDLNGRIHENTVLVSVVAGVIPENLENMFQHKFVLALNKCSMYERIPHMPIFNMELVQDNYLIVHACPVDGDNDSDDNLSFYMKLHYILCSLYEDRVKIVDRVRIALSVILNVEVSSDHVANTFQECMKKYLYQSQEFYKSKDFLQTLVSFTGRSISLLFQERFNNILMNHMRNFLKY
ncbi:NADP-dependent oxidoreductase domain-containing protein [Acrasis kona]|uniref:NADP-dependent oxidoreductase domain-containing protein n=1 Tax=Acrasis kona TaxID=1008807 RepID=A0AAW2ZPQ1_9EUKA